MARDAQQTIQDKVRHLRERYANSVGEKLIEINAAYDQLVGELGGDDPTVAIDGLATPIHKMVFQKSGNSYETWGSRKKSTVTPTFFDSNR